MSDIEITMVPKDLYYHEVAYVRGLEKKNAEIVAERDIAWASNAGLTTDVLALRAKNADLVTALEEIDTCKPPIGCESVYEWVAVRCKRVARAALAAAGHKQGSGG